MTLFSPLLCSGDFTAESVTHIRQSQQWDPCSPHSHLMLVLSSMSLAEFSQKRFLLSFSIRCLFKKPLIFMKQLKNLSNGILGITLAGGDVILSNNLPVSGHPPLGFTY